MDTKQNKIKNIVKLYKDSFPEEYETVKAMIEEVRRTQTDEFSTAQGSTIRRKLYEIPEKLDVALLNGLDAESLAYLKTIDGGRWFASAHPEFSTTRD